MENMNTVTIPVDEYFEMRRRAEESIYIAEKLGGLEQRQLFLESKTAELEGKVNNLYDRP